MTDLVLCVTASLLLAQNDPASQPPPVGQNPPAAAAPVENAIPPAPPTDQPPAAAPDATQQPQPPQPAGDAAPAPFPNENPQPVDPAAQPAPQPGQPAPPAPQPGQPTQPAGQPQQVFQPADQPQPQPQQSFDAGEVQALAAISPEGLVRITTFGFEPAPQGDGYVAYRQISEFNPAVVQAMRADGTPVDAAELPQLLAEEQRVLLSTAGLTQEQSLRGLYSPDTLVLMPTGPVQATREDIPPENANAPSRPAPQGGIATLSNGMIQLVRSVLVPQYETRTVTETIVENGQERNVEKQVQQTVWVVEQKTSQIPANSVAAIDPQGNVIDRQTLAERLSQPTAVLFASEPQQGPVLDPFYAGSLRDDALVLVFPRSTTASPPASVADTVPPVPPPTSPQRPREVSALDRVVARTHRGLAETHYNRCQFTAAIEDLQTAVEHVPGDAELLYVLAYMQYRADDLDAAEESVEEAKAAEAGRPLDNWYRIMEPYQGPARAWLEKQRKRR